MSGKVFNILFVCTHNSARSIMAEGLMNQLGHGRFKAWSAGNQPRGTVHPLALRTLAGWHIPTAGLRSKNWDEFCAPGAPELDFVVTVCDDAAGETCPLWPNQPVTAHWGVPDPSRAEGSEEHQAEAFLEAAITLKRRIELMLALPLDSLDPPAIQHEMRGFGSR